MPDAAFLRRVLAALFLFGSVGTAAELLLLEHTEDAWQKAPLVLIAIGCVVLAVLAVRPSPSMPTRPWCIRSRAGTSAGISSRGPARPVRR